MDATDLPWSVVPGEDSAGPVGLLLVDKEQVTIRHHPDLCAGEHQGEPTDTHLKELYAELLLRPFKMFKDQRRHFIQFNSCN